MIIENNVLKAHLKNVLFINGTAYAGKSTMCALLAKEYGLYHYAETARFTEHLKIADKVRQPNMCYQRKDWDEFFNRTPEDYVASIQGGIPEEAQMALIDLIEMSQNQKVITDTFIPVSTLLEIADYRQIAFLLAPPAMVVEQFFDRDDKNDLLACIQSTPNPDKTMANFKACLAAVNSEAYYRSFSESGCFCLVRGRKDTRQETFDALARHFGLKD